MLALDFYGFGFSEAPLGVEYCADLFVQQAHELLAHLNITEPVILAGHSMGGLLAAVFAVRVDSMPSHAFVRSCVACGCSRDTRNPSAS